MKERNKEEMKNAAIHDMNGAGTKMNRKNAAKKIIREKKMNKNRLYLLMLLAMSGPLVFYFYLQADMVCAPRAIFSSVLFGMVPLFFSTAGIFEKKILYYRIAAVILVIEIIITPIIMLKRLGWEKLVNERIPAFFTFEGFSIAMLVIILMALRNNKNVQTESD